LKTDTFCQDNANPSLYEADEATGKGAIIDNENSEAAEQTFRWMGLFGNMVRTMGQERAYFFLIRMCERHNRRTIGDRILALNEVALLELCAAYQVTVPRGEARDETKRRLTETLLGGKQPYDLAALDAHRAAVAAERERACERTA